MNNDADELGVALDVCWKRVDLETKASRLCNLLVDDEDEDDAAITTDRRIAVNDDTHIMTIVEKIVRCLYCVNNSAFTVMIEVGRCSLR